jgi:hypothetical protein
MAREPLLIASWLASLRRSPLHLSTVMDHPISSELVPDRTSDTDDQQRAHNVVALSLNHDQETIEAIELACAAAYLGEDAAFEELCTTIHVLMVGP